MEIVCLPAQRTVELNISKVGATIIGKFFQEQFNCRRFTFLNMKTSQLSRLVSKSGDVQGQVMPMSK